MLTLGTGVGGGLVLGGKLYRGQHVARRSSGTSCRARPLRAARPLTPATSRSPARWSRWRPVARSTASRVESARAHPKSFLGRRLADGRRGHRARRRWRAPARATSTAATSCASSASASASASPTRSTSSTRDEVVIGGGVSRAGDLLLKPAERDGAAPHRAGRRRADRDPPRAARPAGRRARRGDDGRAGVHAGDRREEPRPMRIACAFDHAGFPLKPVVLADVEAAGHEPMDLGTHSTDPVDYPDIARIGERGGARRTGRAGGGGLRLRRRRRRRRMQDPGHPGLHGARHLHGAPGGRARRRQRAVPRRPGGRAGLRGGDHRRLRRGASSAGRSATCAGWRRSRPSKTSSRGASRGHRGRVRGRLPPDRRARARRRPAHGRPGRHGRHDRLVLLPGLRRAERVRRDPRQGPRRLLRAPSRRGRLDVQAALLPRHERPHHPLLHARRRGRGAGLHADRGAARACTATG